MPFRTSNRLDDVLKEAVSGWVLGPLVHALQALRGVKLTAAGTLVAKIGDLHRFGNPKQLMAWLGLVPAEHSSGNRIKRGEITRTGNAVARTMLIESAWHYRFPAREGRSLIDRNAELPEQLFADWLPHDPFPSWTFLLQLSGHLLNLPPRRIEDYPTQIRPRSTPAKSNVCFRLPSLLLCLKAARSELRNPDQLRPPRYRPISTATGGVWRAISQTKPVSSRATAATTLTVCFPDAASLRNLAQRRTCAFQAMALIC